MGTAHPRAVVLDAGALIALEKGDDRMRALCREALKSRARIVVPAGVVAQVFRDRARQVVLRGLLGAAITDVPPLDHILAEAAGILCGRARTSDVIDASVVLTALRLRAAVVTSDVGDLRRLDISVRLERI